MTLNFVLAESALELVPKRLWNHPAVIAHARKRRKQPSQILLDISYHHSAMRILERDRNIEKPYIGKHGRPDIVHMTLLTALGTPLNLERQLKVHIHTTEDRTIRVHPSVRLPRNYDRFQGLMEQLLVERRVPGEKPLLAVENKNLSALLNQLDADLVLGFSVNGRPASISDAAKRLARAKRPVAIVGGFARGHYTRETLDACHELIRIDKASLDAWVVASRLIYEHELSIGLPPRRLT